MPGIKDILANALHRPYELPAGKWRYYQEWNNALFLHWKIPYDILRKMIPMELDIDTFHGDCYISLVAFTMQKIRPRNLPSIGFISDFEEINLRTYVSNDNKQGVYFLNIEAGKSLSVFVAKILSELPYEKANIQRDNNNYKSSNLRKAFHFDTEFIIKEKLLEKTELDKWLTERYCLFLSKNDKLSRYDIHHKEWEIRDVQIKRLSLEYKIGGVDLSLRPPEMTHYSEGVKVIAWRRKPL